MMNKYLLSIQYDGTEYNGFVKQDIKSTKTIYNVLFNAIKLIVKKNEIILNYASRTDAGTHAKDQKCLLSLSFKIQNINSFLKTLNIILPISIFVNNIVEKNNNFEIKNYQKKIYKYYINISNKYDIFLSRYEWMLDKKKFNYKKFKKSLNLFKGEHNFLNFSKQDKEKNTKTIRKIEKICVKKNLNQKIIISFAAYGFIRYQIRYIVGTCVAYAKGQTTLLKIQEMLNANVKMSNKFKAPSRGLVLNEIIF